MLLESPSRPHRGHLVVHGGLGNGDQNEPAYAGTSRVVDQTSAPRVDFDRIVTAPGSHRIRRQEYRLDVVECLRPTPCRRQVGLDDLDSSSRQDRTAIDGPHRAPHLVSGGEQGAAAPGSELSVGADDEDAHLPSLGERTAVGGPPGACGFPARVSRQTCRAARISRVLWSASRRALVWN